MANINLTTPYATATGVAILSINDKQQKWIKRKLKEFNNINELGD